MMRSGLLVRSKFSSIVNEMRPSAIDITLKVLSDPEMISFGGGMPNPESFPVNEILQILNERFPTKGKNMLQYGPINGTESLRNAISEMLLKREGIKISPNNIILTSGSQQGLYMLGKLLADRGDYVITEAPTYVDAIVSFRASGIRMIGVEMDSAGMKTEKLRETLKRYPRPRFIYVIPNFQNPTGITMSLERRKEILEIVEEKGIALIEDDPYGNLRFCGRKIPPIKSLDESGDTIYLGTFSKILSPGLRLGYIAGPDDVIEKLLLEKEAIDIGSSTLSQFIAEEYISRGYLEKHIPKIIKLYKHKRDLMIESFESYFPDNVQFTRPEGGMFIWVTKKGTNTDKMLPFAINRKVVYVVGSAFYPNRGDHSSMRLNFTYSSDENIVEGVKRLASVFRDYS